MKSNLVPRIVAGCAFIIYFFFSFIAQLVYGMLYGGIFSYFDATTFIYFLICFIGLTLLAVSLFIDFRILAAVGCGICIIRWLPQLINSFKFYFQAKDNTYGDLSFLDLTAGIIFSLLFILTFALLLFASIFKKASLFLGIGAAVSVLSIIILLIYRALSWFNTGNAVEIVSFIFLIAGCITMGIAFSREKIKKMPVNNPSNRPQPYQSNQRW